MKRIVIHWTAGGYLPNATDLEHYHYLIGFDKAKNKAILYNGKYKPEDNLNCNDGRYAAHTGGGNTGSIGIAVCGMAGFKGASNLGAFPLKQAQMELCYSACAKLLKKYAIVLSPATVFTHYEFGKKNPQTSSAGKIDINFLPFEPSIPANKVGDYIRQKINWYYQKLDKEQN